MRAGWMWLALAVGCGPRLDPGVDSDAGTSESGSTPDPSTTSTSGLPPTTTAPPVSTTGAATQFTTTDPETTSASSMGFIQNPDFICSVDPTVGPLASCFECTIWDQDCPEGRKCMPWANDGGELWNATRCSDIDASPGRPGDPCVVEGSAVSGVDSCDVATMCWNVDPETNTGTCIAMCMGTADAPVCDDPTTACFVAEESYIAVCAPPCDPLLPACAVGHGCWPDDHGQWGCIPEGAGITALNQTSPLCAPGSIDVHPSYVSSCDPDVELCCMPLCDLTAPDCAPELTCAPFYEDGRAPAGHEDVGVCLDP